MPEYSYSLDEEGIGSTAFELIFAFDEVISLGHKENVTVTQVKQYCEMESHEERLHKLVLQNKINETKDVMKRKASEIDKSKVVQKAHVTCAKCLISSLFMYLVYLIVLITPFSTHLCRLRRIEVKKEVSCLCNPWVLGESILALAVTQAYLAEELVVLVVVLDLV